MKNLKLFMNALTVLAVSFVLALLSYQALEGVDLTQIITYAVGALDVIVLVATFINLFFYKRNTAMFVPSFIPGAAMALALIFEGLNITVPSAALLVFDFYVLYWYGYMLVGKFDE